MQGIDLSLNYIGAKSDIALLEVKGFLDTATSTVVSNKLREIFNKEIFQLVIDMSSVNYVSSAGWGVFVGEIRNIRESGGDLKIVQMTPDVYEVFEMLEFNRILDYYETIEESVNDFDICAGVNITNGNKWKKNATSVPKVNIEAPLPKDLAVKPGAHGQKKSKSRFVFTKPKTDEARLPLVEKIKAIVIDNPNDNILQIRKKLNTQRFGFERIGFLKLRTILKNYNLETRDKRYRYYRSR
ncbi:hypothetical protein B6I21_04870 [candidate division KSB1 bacterium 4572_119]|nr:MAG: hypothetical protein B6I21_04870 [candidate division KSB1 bacterium 4572_119]